MHCKCGEVAARGNICEDCLKELLNAKLSFWRARAKKAEVERSRLVYYRRYKRKFSK